LVGIRTLSWQDQSGTTVVYSQEISTTEASLDGEMTYKHIDDLTPEARTARDSVEAARVEWVAERTRARDSS
jgi:hypothetical protein